MINKNKLKKTISFILIQAFLLSILPVGINRRAYASSEESGAATRPRQQEIIANPDAVVIPREFGLVKSRFAGNTGKLIIHIQDAHCNYEAQSNIVSMLKGMIKNYGLSLISVEGADGIIDTSWFKAFPDEGIRKEVASHFMKKGEITGPEFLAITTDYPIKLFGAETRSYYIRNLNAFTSSFSQKAAAEQYCERLKAALGRLKDYIYNEDLKKMDARSREYEAKRIPFNDYVRFIQETAERHKIDLREYGDFFRLVNVLAYEKRIDFNLTDKERSALIDELTKSISRDELAELVNRSMSFKTAGVSSADYYNFLKGLAAKRGIDTARRFPNLYNYTIYNSTYAKIENERLFRDISRIETEVKKKLFENDDQRALERLSRHADVLSGLVSIKLLNGDYEYYKRHRDEFTYDAFSDFIKTQAERYALPYDVEPSDKAVAKSVSKLEEFYEVAIRRDKELVDNTLVRMDAENQRLAVLITGGFHSEGIAKLLEKQGVSYVIVCPSITKDAPTPYLEILMNQRASLDDILVDTTTM